MSVCDQALLYSPCILGILLNIKKTLPFLQQLIGNTNWTVWSTIQGAIAQVISKSNSLDETAVASFVLKENVIVEMTLNGGIYQPTFRHY